MTETLRAAALFGLTEAEVLDDARDRDETGQTDIDGQPDMRPTPASGVDPREEDAEQGPPHMATHRGDGKAAEVPERDHLDDTDEDGGVGD